MDSKASAGFRPPPSALRIDWICTLRIGVLLRSISGIELDNGSLSPQSMRRDVTKIIRKSFSSSLPLSTEYHQPKGIFFLNNRRKLLGNQEGPRFHHKWLILPVTSQPAQTNVTGYWSNFRTTCTLAPFVLLDHCSKREERRCSCICIGSGCLQAQSRRWLDASL